MTSPCCMACKFFMKNDSTDFKEITGRCRRRAPVPTIMPMGAQFRLVWPGVNGNEWCGEFIHINAGKET